MTFVRSLAILYWTKIITEGAEDLALFKAVESSHLCTFTMYYCGTLRHCRAPAIITFGIIVICEKRLRNIQVKTQWFSNPNAHNIAWLICLVVLHADIPIFDDLSLAVRRSDAWLKTHHSTWTVSLDDYLPGSALYDAEITQSGSARMKFQIDNSPVLRIEQHA